MDRCFQFAAAAGFDGIELMVDSRWDTRQPDFLQSLVDKHELPILAVHAPFKGVPGWPQDGAGRVEQSLKLAETVGAEVVVLHPSLTVGRVWIRTKSDSFSLPTWAWNAEWHYRNWMMYGLEGLQARTDVKLCVENMPAYRFWGKRMQLAEWGMWERLPRFPHVTIDTTHLGTWGLEPIEVYPLIATRIHHIHLSNYNGQEHRRPDNGRLQLNKFLSRLQLDGYQGLVSLEVYPEELDAGQPDARVIERMSSSLNQMRDWANQPAEQPVPLSDLRMPSPAW